MENQNNEVINFIIDTKRIRKAIKKFNKAHRDMLKIAENPTIHIEKTIKVQY